MSIPTHRSKQAILKDTAEFYGEDPQGRRSNIQRADYGPTCYYLDEATGNRCAFGRYMTDKQLARAKEEGMLGEGVVTLEANCPEIFDGTDKSSFLGVSIQFWEMLQDLHDCDKNWAETGLTPDGMRVVSAICTEYSLDAIDILGDRAKDVDWCECDTSHREEDTVCQFCHEKGRRKWNDPTPDKE